MGESIINNGYRCGNFTSSNIHKLMTLNRKGDDFGAPALEYIDEVNMTRLLGRSLSIETNSKPTSWGKLLENRVFDDLLGLDYTLSSQITDVHPTIDFWAGSKDGTKECEERTVIDIKCPATLKAFCQLVMPIYKGMDGMDAINEIRENSKSGDAYYWQLVSNAIINGCDWAELVVYVPYKSELLAIYELAKGNPSVKWLEYADSDEIPYLIDGGYFKNLNKIRFKVPQDDKDLLTSTVLRAGEKLIPRPIINQQS